MIYKSIYILTCILLLISIPVKSQNNFDRKFDTAYFNSFREENVEEMLKIGYSLYRASTTNIHKIKSLSVIASAYSRQLKTSASIIYWKKIDSMGRKGRLPDWETLANERLANEYLKLGLLDASKKFLQRALVSSKSLSGSLESKYIYAMIYETEALQKIENNDTIGFIKGIKYNLAYLQNLPKNNIRDYLLNRSHLRLGEVYVQRNSLDSASYSFKIAENNFKKLSIKSNFNEKATLYKGLGNLALKRRQFEEAKKYLLEARKIAMANKNQKMTDLIIRDLRRYYRAVYDYPELFKINLIKDSLDQIKKNQLLNVADRDFKDVFAKKNKFAGYIDLLMSGAVILIFIIVSLLLYYRYQRKKNKQQFDKIITKLKAQQKLATAKNLPVSEKKYSIVNEEDSSLQISAEKEEELVKKLEAFEENLRFLDKDISKPKMSSYLNTNIKYLSYIIKKYRGSDFSEYINNNRINYITKQLYTQSEYKNYKISYLAELCGYSSHSRFANIFKKQMDISPSDFIAQFQKRTDKGI